eukprot:8288077-Pyramimonas_sp.AAC.1
MSIVVLPDAASMMSANKIMLTGWASPTTAEPTPPMNITRKSRSVAYLNSVARDATPTSSFFCGASPTGCLLRRSGTRIVHRSCIQTAQQDVCAFKNRT